MSSFKRLVSGALFGGALLIVGSAALSSDALAQTAKWAISCDGNYCCTVNQDTGAVGQCWNK